MQMGRKSTFTAAQKRDAVMVVISKRKTVSETCREPGISETTFARWREQALEGMQAALADKDSRNSREDVLAKQLAKAERTIGQLAPENDLLGKASRRLT
jgi:transposase-like protein